MALIVIAAITFMAAARNLENTALPLPHIGYGLTFFLFSTVLDGKKLGYFNPLLMFAYTLRERKGFRFAFAVFIFYTGLSIIGVVLANIMLDQWPPSLPSYNDPPETITYNRFLTEAFFTFFFVTMIMAADVVKPEKSPMIGALIIILCGISLPYAVYMNPSLTLAALFSETPHSVNRFLIVNTLLAQLVATLFATIFVEVILSNRDKK